MEGDGSSAVKRPKGNSERTRSYQTRWDETYFTILYKEEIRCVICQTTLAQPKESNIKRHYNTHQKLLDEWDLVNDERRTHKYQLLKANLIGDCSSASDTSTENERERVTRASYRIAEELTKHGKPFSDGEIIKKCLLIAAEEVPDVNLFPAISLSRNVVAQRVNDIGEDLERQLKDLCPTFVKFSLALDESTDVVDTAQLCVFIKGSTEDLETYVELLDILPLVSTTTGEDIFEKVEELFATFSLDWRKLESVATDGAPAMTGLIKGLKGKILSKLEQLGLPPITFIHCFIHQEQLCAKTLSRANAILQVVTKVINLIRGRALNHREFKLLVSDFDLDCEDLLFHSAVRWLSCGKSASRFVALKEPILIFLKEKSITVPELDDESWWTELGFQTDMCNHLNKLNLSLQGRNKLITNFRDKIKAFKIKLQLYKLQLSTNNLENFPTLMLLCPGVKVSPEQCQKFVQCLTDLSAEFEARFSDLDLLSEKFQLFTSPFTVDPLDPQLPVSAEELIDLQCDSSLNDAQKRLEIDEFWSKVVKTKRFPSLCSFVAGIFCMFGSTYDCECTFSLMKFVKNKHRNRLSNKHLSFVLRIMTASKLKADIVKIVKERKQNQFAKSA